MNRLKQLRTEHGLSMREVANRINVPYTTYVNYEKGVRDPSTEVLGKLAKFFETTVDYLLGISDNVSVNNFKLPEIEETDNGLVFSFEKWIDMDLEYINDQGIWCDFKIILKTIPAVFNGDGAY